ncbi:MAG: glycosyltransferase family 2 protein [Janthinobacterium lividum]
MDGSLINLGKRRSLADLAELLITEKLISKSQLYYIFLTQILSNYDSIYELLLDENIISNECLMTMLCRVHNYIELSEAYEVAYILDYARINYYVKKGYFKYTDSRGVCNIAVNNLKILPKIFRTQSIKNIKLITLEKFYFVLVKNFSHLNLIKSKYYLDFISPALTAKNIDYNKSIFGFVIMFFTTLFSSCMCFNIVNNMGHLAQSFLKLLLFRSAIYSVDQQIHCSNSTSLPIYSVLIPLYKEEEKIESILEFVDNFSYPKDKLDVKIIVEDDDYSLIDKISCYEVPNHIRVMKVPVSLPRTKPKALNYAMPFCKGKYIVVYDAEDRPERDQLLKAVHSFNSLPNVYACLQARLNFYNSEENLLTKFLSIEYSLWFNYLLKGLSRLDLPVTLGGTSNHFRAEVLKRICWWDAYNVTEDADLGIRLYSLGYKVHMIDSNTFEEAPIRLNCWLKQRSRWIKGFMQTFFIFLNRDKKSSVLYTKQVISIYIFVGISSYSFFCLPWLLIMIYRNPTPVINYLWLFNSFFSFCYIYSTTYYVLIKAKGNLSHFKMLDYLSLTIIPFYFLLHTIASYMALWESLMQPFKWNKTTHGLSSVKLPLKLPTIH